MPRYWSCLIPVKDSYAGDPHHPTTPSVRIGAQRGAGEPGRVDRLVVLTPLIGEPIPVFGHLLGDDAGHWSIGAADAEQVIRRYLDRTMVLETTFRTSTGTVTIADALAIGKGNRGHALGQGAAASSAATGDVG